MNPAESEKIPSKDSITVPARYHNIYICPFSQRLIHAFVVVLLVLFVCFYDDMQSNRSLLAIFFLGGAISSSLAAILLDPETSVRTTRSEGNDGGEKGDGDKDGRVVIVQRPIIGFEGCKLRLEATEAMNEWFGGVQHEEALIRV